MRTCRLRVRGPQDRRQARIPARWRLITSATTWTSEDEPTDTAVGSPGAATVTVREPLCGDARHRRRLEPRSRFKRFRSASSSPAVCARTSRTFSSAFVTIRSRFWRQLRFEPQRGVGVLLRISWYTMPGVAPLNGKTPWPSRRGPRRTRTSRCAHQRLAARLFGRHVRHRAKRRPGAGQVRLTGHRRQHRAS